jgi:formylglycine-generating enzyme required for sulfatase activity
MEKRNMKSVRGLRLFCVLGGLAVLSPALGAQTGLPVMVRVEGGTFLMGGGEPGGAGAREVTLSPFFLAETEVTQALWKEVTGGNPSRFAGDDRPVDSVSWLDAAGFCNALSEKAGLPPAYEIAGNTVTWRREAGGYRLPTESEWEYAARGGIGGVSGGAPYAGGEKPEDIGWYDGNSGRTSHPVKGKAPNGLGLYDMSGNLWEWCWDWYGEYPRQAAADPAGPAESTRRVLRGGAWFTPANLLRVTGRYWNSPGFRANSVGFRLARNGK